MKTDKKEILDKIALAPFILDALIENYCLMASKESEEDPKVIKKLLMIRADELRKEFANSIDD